MMRVTSYIIVHRPERVLCYLPEVTEEVNRCIGEGKCPPALEHFHNAYGTYDDAGVFYLPMSLRKQLGHDAVVGIEVRARDLKEKIQEGFKTIVLPASDVIIQSVAFEKALSKESLDEVIDFARNKRNDKSKEYSYKEDGLVTAFFSEERLRVLYEIELLDDYEPFANDHLESFTKEELYSKAYREPVTGYYNWTWFVERIKTYHLNGILDYCFVHFDIKEFKMLNELYGHHVADSHLRCVTRQIEKNRDWIYFGARCDNDNFALMIHDMPQELIRMKLERFFDEISLLEYDPNYHVYYRCGVVEMQTAINTGEVVADCAKLAKAMGQGINVTEINFYNSDRYTDFLWGKQLKAYLNTAIEQNEFVVYLQPKMDIEKEQIVGAEALVRWNYKHKEFMTPYRFISHLEADDSIVKVDEVVLHKVCEKLTEWKNAGYKLYPISVNLSRKHMEKENLADHLSRIVDLYHVDHSLIEFELTESVAYNNQSYMISVLNDLKKHGFQISMDDFGTGYSSFGLLKEMPLDTLKIDKSFVDMITTDETSYKIQVILRHIIAMSKELGVNCIAEGAEEYSQVHTLKELGCDTVQGYYYSKPISTDVFVEKYLVKEASC